MIDDYYAINTPPAEEPITLSEAKEWCRVTTTDDDSLITSLISAVRIFGERYCNRIFVDTSIDCFFAGLDSSNQEPYSFVQVRRAPLSSITAVSSYISGIYTATTDYLLKQSTGFSRLIFKNSITADSDIEYPLKVEAVFGYGAAADVPEEIKTALKAHVAFLYENRGDVAASANLAMPLETKAIYLKHYRILNTF